MYIQGQENWEKSGKIIDYYVLYLYCTYKLKWKPLFDGVFLGVLSYEVMKVGGNRTKLYITMYSMYTAHISSNRSHFLTAGFFVS